MEVRSLEKLWAAEPSKARSIGAALVLTGRQATERAFKQLAPGNRVLHVATHGFRLTRSCEPQRSSDPLLLSGLALAGANSRAGGDGEDGMLTAEEIASLDLFGVEWVVLSGCDTGLGEVLAGEGVLGLRRAFVIAGADSLINSLWSVDDDTTRAWMESLYEARMRGLSTAGSVRQASLDLLRYARSRGRSTHPFSWGAFVAVGDWR